MKRFFINVIFAVELMIVFPLVCLIYFLPIALTSVLIRLVFDDDSFLVAIVSVGIWGWIYFKTSFGAKAMDFQQALAEKVTDCMIDLD